MMQTKTTSPQARATHGYNTRAARELCASRSFWCPQRCPNANANGVLESRRESQSRLTMFSNKVPTTAATTPPQLSLRLFCSVMFPFLLFHLLLGHVYRLLVPLSKCISACLSSVVSGQPRRTAPVKGQTPVVSDEAHPAERAETGTSWGMSFKWGSTKKNSSAPKQEWFSRH